MKRVLAFSFFPAYAPPSNGGETRLLHFYQALSQWFQVTLLTSAHLGTQEETINHGINFTERRVPKDEYFAREYARLEQYSGGGDCSGPALAASGAMPTLWHKAYLEEYERADVIFHDSPFSVGYDIFATLDDKLRIYNSYNCETLLYRQLHPDEKSSPIHDLVRIVEQRMLENSDLVLYCNENDLSAFREMVPGAGFESLYVPNGMTPSAVQQSIATPPSEKFRAVFMGSGHPPNVKAAEFIAFSLAPALPEVQFDIIGSCLPAARYPSNVHRHGVVDHATKVNILSQASIALNPMSEGSGSNVKVLEYFAYGLPVISTEFGMRGIRAEAEQEYLRASLDDFAIALANVARDSRSLSNIGARGKELALKAYTWKSIAQSVAERLRTLDDISREKPERRFVFALNDYDSFGGFGGGNTRTRGLYEAVQVWSPVVFCCFSVDGTLKVERYTENITVIMIPKTSEHISELALLNAQFHVSVDDIVASRHCLLNPWLQAVYRMLRQNARCIVIEHCYLVHLPVTWGDRFIYSSHNNEADLKKRLLQYHPLQTELCAEVERLEQLAVECSATTIAVSQEDAASLVQGKRTAGPVIVVRNGAATPASGDDVERKKADVIHKIGKHSTVFLGSAHMPNVEAARFIVESLAPACPNVEFHLIGSVCSSVLKSSRNVHLWGVVDEVTKSALLQSCALALNPMSAGSGSNVKLADYLGNGLFVLTTEFGQRGYPPQVHEHLAIAPLDQFAELIQELLTERELFSSEARAVRYSVFESVLAMRSLGEQFVATLQSMERRKTRVLYVAYRYVVPALGGAEINMERFIRALGLSGEFDIDVVSPEVSGIHNYWRFSENYTFGSEMGAPTDVPNVRFARFPVDSPKKSETDVSLRRAWGIQPEFERVLNQQLTGEYLETGITWGWDYPEGTGERWAFTGCGLYLANGVQVEVCGYATSPVVITVYSKQQIINGPQTVEGSFQLGFMASEGSLEFHSSAHVVDYDPRPLAFKVSSISVGGAPLDLSTPTLIQKTLQALPANDVFMILDKAAAESRTQTGVRLTDGRGPWSNGLEQFIRDHVKDYDLVVAHNSVFRPAIVAIEEAKNNGVPSILVPHVHLDDDFYHFPDVLQAARNASVALTVPKAACDFLREKGCNAQYLPAGCDTTEQFTDMDREVFREIYGSDRKFVLVLGRKAGAKGYRYIIEAVEALNRNGVDLQVVLIGPDDDGVSIDNANTTYLGRQPRNVVRGALLSCVALVNMSSSESFGIVLLEAWLAGKPVIANKNCAAFHDMAVDGENSLLVAPENTAEAISKLLTEPTLGVQLAENGRKTAELFDWDDVESKFVAWCAQLSQPKPKRVVIENYAA